MRVAVSGTNGFVGKALVVRLLQAGHIVVPVVRDAGGSSAAISTGDLAAPVLPTAVPALDTVVHLAAHTHARHDDAADSRLWATNVEGTRALLAIARAGGTRRFVFLSSAKVNGERTAGHAFTADDVPAPEDAYGRSKLAAEQLVRTTCAEAGIDFAILRPPLVYGPGQKGNLRALAMAVRRGIPLPFGCVENSRSLIHVANLADLISVAATRPGTIGRVLMADDGTRLSTPDLIRAMGKGAGRPARLLPIPPVLIETAARLAGRSEQAQRLLGDLEVDGEATRTALNWRPIVPRDYALADAGAL